MADTTKKILPLVDLANRHPGLTEAVANSYLEAARVCLDRYHNSPADFRLKDESNESVAQVDWALTDDRIRRAWANTDDATRDGAYAVALASTEMSRNLVAISRAETKTGADYYVAPPGADGEDMEAWLRLEVSGTDLDEKQVGYRLHQKVSQANKGDSNLPALAAVVGFKSSIIALRSVIKK